MQIHFTRPRRGGPARRRLPRARARGRRAHAHLGRRAARAARRAPRRGARAARWRRSWAPRFPRYYKRRRRSPQLGGARHRLLRAPRDAAASRSWSACRTRPTSAASARASGSTRRAARSSSSEAMPMLEDLGLRVIEEVPTRLQGGDGETWVQDFGVLGPGDRPLDLERLRRPRGRLHLRRLARRDRVRLAQPAGARGRARLAPGRDPARLPQLPPADRLALHRELPERRAGGQRGGDRASSCACSSCASTPSTRATRRPRRRCARRSSPTSTRSSSLDHDRILRNQLGLIEATAAHQRLPPRPRRDGLQAALGRRARRSRSRRRCSRSTSTRPTMEGIHLRGGADRARRHPLVGPAWTTAPRSSA